MGKKGFAFIETIITVVLLSTSLLYLYNSYSSIISSEESRLYYDDPAYVYKTNYVRKFLEENTDVENVKSYAFNNSYITSIGPDFESMFNENQINDGMKETLEEIVLSFNINQILLVKSSFFLECGSEEDTGKCSIFNDINYNVKQYLKSLNDTSYEYYLVIEYSEKINDDGKIIKCNPGSDKCVSYFANLGI